LVAIGGSAVTVVIIVAVSVNRDARSCNCCDDDIVVVAVCHEVFSFVSFRLFDCCSSIGSGSKQRSSLAKHYYS